MANKEYGDNSIEFGVSNYSFDGSKVMAAFTMNTVQSKHPWLVADGQSTDVSTSTAFIAAVAGNSHLVRKISIDYQKGVDGRWIKVLDGTDLQIGPVKPSRNDWELDLGEDAGLLFEDGVFIQTDDR